MKAIAMLKMYSSVLCIAFALMVIGTLPATANVVKSANATATCQGYNLTVNTAQLTVGQTYTIDYSFTVTCGGGSPTTIPGSTTFTATATTETVTASGTFPTGTLTGSCDVTGSATLAGFNTVPISVNGTTSGAPLSCPPSLMLVCSASTGTVGVPYTSCLSATGGLPPYTFGGVSGVVPGLNGTLNPTTGCFNGTPAEAGTFSFVLDVTDSESPPMTATATCPFNIASALPTACVIPPSGTAIPGSPVSWNGFTAPPGSVVWVNAHISNPGNVPTDTITTVDFTGVSLVVNATTYALPNGQIVFNPATSTPTTVVNADGSWTTTVPATFSNDIFFVGQAIPVDSNLENGGGGNTGSTLSFQTNSSDNALKFQWQWGAAVYTYWPGNANAMIEPVHAAQQAGAPLDPTTEAALIQGPRGGGGSNFTGSWSGTGQGTCPQ
jgi:hypothetical protein